MRDGRRLVIAIDGPAGAGKSTVARRVAERLGLAHLDTGAMYRAVTLAALEAGVDLGDEGAVRAVAEAASIDPGEHVVLLDGRDVTAAIRDEHVTAAVSSVARHPSVRRVLIDRQREWVAARAGALAEGRDIASVVLPDATLKVWLTASPRVRAERRHAETGDERSVEEIAADIERRDRADADQTHRTDDAVVVDTTAASIDAVVERIVHLAGTSATETRPAEGGAP